MRTLDQIRDRAGRTALLVAARNLRTATCEKLLSSGKLEVLSSVDVQDDTGRTAVVYACRQVLGHTEWVATWRWLRRCQDCLAVPHRLQELHEGRGGQAGHGWRGECQHLPQRSCWICSDAGSRLAAYVFTLHKP